MLDPAPRRRAGRLGGLPAVLRRLAGSGTGRAPGAGSALSPAAASRRQRLLAYTAAEIVLGAGLVVWSTFAWPIQPAIDPGFAGGTVLAGPTGGLLLWLVYGLLGSLRVLRAPGGALMTFHMPFIGAAMVLGGPTAGAWVAMLSTIERRELESQPWYGVLANHSTLAIGAVAGGLTTQVLGGLLGAGTVSTAALVAAAAGTLVLAAVSIGLGVVTVVLRDEVIPREFLGVLVTRIGRITALECALVLVLAAAYVQFGWWSPLVVGAFVLLVWDNDPAPAPDPLTGLLTRRGFERQFESGLGRLRHGLVPGAALLAIDLDLFNEVNNRFGHQVGDEVLGQVGARLKAVARRPNDLAARLGGDEFALFLPGLSDPETAMRRAEEAADAITATIATSVGPVVIGVSIGVNVVDGWGGVASGATLVRQADKAMFIAKRDGTRVHRFDPDEPDPWDDERLAGRRGRPTPGT